MTNVNPYAVAFYAFITFIALVLLEGLGTRWNGYEAAMLALTSVLLWLVKVKKCL